MQRQKAEEIVIKVNIEFTTSRGWLDGFSKHNRISLLLRKGKFCFRSVWRTKQTMLDMFFKKKTFQSRLFDFNHKNRNMEYIIFDHPHEPLFTD
jgi:hypothetical protein